MKTTVLLEEREVHAIFYIIRQLAHQVRRENLHRVAILALALIFFGSLAFWFFEEKLGFFDAFWWAVVTGISR